MKKIESTLLVEQVYKILWQEIVRRNLKPNQKLDINSLADQMAVSRTPIMDALARLEKDGLVLRRNRVGTFVTPLNRDTFIASFQARDMVEQYMTPVSMENITPSHVKSLNEVLTHQSDLLTGVNDENFDYAAYTRHDQDFHMTLVELCDNPRIIDFYRSLNSHMLIARAYSSHALDRATEGLVEHRQILHAFADKSVAEAQRVQRLHLERSREGVLNIIDEHGFL